METRCILDTCPSKEDGCEHGCLLWHKLFYMFKESGLPEHYWRKISMKCPKNFEDQPQFCRLNEIKNNIVEYFYDNHNNLCLWSKNTGNGKTSWAIKLLQSWFLKSCAFCGACENGIYVSVQAYCSQMKNFNNPNLNKYKESLKNTSLLVLDDIGVTRASEYEASILFEIVDHRILSGLPTIYTTNLSVNDLAKNLGTRLADRIWNTSEVIQFNARGLRGVKFE